MRTRFTEKQGQYLAFTDMYMVMHGRAPAEADLQRFFQSTPPTIHQMILTLEEKGLISRVPGGTREVSFSSDFFAPFLTAFVKLPMYGKVNLMKRPPLGKETDHG